MNAFSQSFSEQYYICISSEPLEGTIPSHIVCLSWVSEAQQVFIVAL